MEYRRRRIRRRLACIIACALPGHLIISQANRTAVGNHQLGVAVPAPTIVKSNRRVLLSSAWRVAFFVLRITKYALSYLNSMSILCHGHLTNRRKKHEAAAVQKSVTEVSS